MLDIQLLRNDPAAIAARLKTRGYVLDVARFESTEARRKSVQTRTQELQARRNAVSKAIGSAKGRGEDATALMSEVAGLGEELKALETELDDIQSELREWLLAMPNLPHASVPVGTSETQNVELRRVGTPPAFGFEARDHVDVGGAVGGLEFEQSAKLSGSRFYTLRGNVARLHRALSQWMLDLHSAEHGYVECYVPYVVNRAAPVGTGQPRSSRTICSGSPRAARRTRTECI
jgi:seryl-tRNA synthetase